MKCPRCRTDNPENKKFCRECAARLVRACPRCETEVLPGDKYCGNCAQDLRKPVEPPPIDYAQPPSYTPSFLADKILTTRNSIEGERKLVTVLFSDVANYTSISEKLDPEDVHQIMQGYFRIIVDEIHGCEGTIDKFTGDGVMALFGAPVAHEDHAQRACQAALSIQRAVSEYGDKVKEDRGVDFKMRVGLNSGPVIVGTIGDDLKMDYTAIGDTTNLASRLETMARPGSVLVSQNTYRFARDYFEFASLGRVAVKGREKPEEAYELIGPSAVKTRIQASVAKGLTKFVGRESEMEALREAFDRARAGAGQVVGVTGEAGVGKSRVLLEFRDTLPQGEHRYLEGRCLHYGGSVVYWPILGILKSCFGIREGDEEQSILKKVQDGLSQLDETLLGGLPPLQDVLSLKIEDEGYLQIDPQQRRQRIFEAIRDLLIRLSKEKPLVLAIEDLHWIDTASQDFLDFFAAALADVPILLILLYRPEYDHAQANRAYLNQIVLHQLSTKASAELVQATLEGGKVAPELRELIISKGGGNPLFVEELTSNLLENGSIHRKGDRYVLAREASEIEVPDTLQGIIAARMDRLEENLRQIMRVASVIGREFAYRILQAVTTTQEDLRSSLLNLQGLEFIYEKQLFPELEYVFKHALTQEVAYNSLLTTIRSEIHEKIGNAVEQLFAGRLEEYYELLAFHYERSANTAKAVEYLGLASRKAASAYDMERAMGYFDKAMELLDTLPDTEENRERRISLLVSQSFVFRMLMRLTEYHDLLVRHEPLAVRLDNPVLIAEFFAVLGNCEMVFGYFDQAIKTLNKAATLCDTGENVEAPGLVFNSLVNAHSMRSETEQLFIHKEALLRAMQNNFQLRYYCGGLSTASIAYAQLGRWHEAIELGEKALHAAQDYSDNSMVSSTASSLLIAYTYKRDLERAIECGELAVASAPTPADVAMAQVFLAWPLCHTGETKRGIEVLAAFVPILSAGRIVVFELPATLFLADGYLLAREYDKGREIAERLLELADSCGARLYTGYANLFLGQISIETSPPHAASHFDKSIAVFREIKSEPNVALTYAGYGRLHKQQGNVEQAREYLTKALEIFERLGTLIEPDKVRKELAELPPP